MADFGFLLRVWMVSFFIVIGRLTECSLKYKPQALQTGSPAALRRHSEVVLVWQLEQFSPVRFVVACRRREFLTSGLFMPFIL